MLQIIDDGTGNYDNYHIKIMAYEITRTTFKIKYAVYLGTAGTQFVEQVVQPLTVQYVAWGYGVGNTNSFELSRSIL
jgi:hypothetical protein